MWCLGGIVLGLCDSWQYICLVTNRWFRSCATKNYYKATICSSHHKLRICVKVIKLKSVTILARTDQHGQSKERVECNKQHEHSCQKVIDSTCPWVWCSYKYHQTITIYRLGQKMWHFTFVRIFTNYWSIFAILSLAHSVDNLQ